MGYALIKYTRMISQVVQKQEYQTMNKCVKEEVENHAPTQAPKAWQPCGISLFQQMTFKSTIPTSNESSTSSSFYKSTDVNVPPFFKTHQ